MTIQRIDMSAFNSNQLNIDILECCHNSAFTLIELLVSMGILAVIFAIATVGLSNIIPNASQSNTKDVLISDLRAQQTKAMSTNGYYGIHFGTTDYTLFTGAVYSPSDPSNFIVQLDPTVNITADTFSSGNIVFSPGSGDISVYASGSDSLTLTNSQTNNVTTIRINKYGATY